MTLKWSHGHATSTTARLLFWSDESGTLSVTYNGRTATATIDPATDDGTALVVLDHLTAPTPFATTLNTSRVTGIARPMPSRAPYRAAWTSCIGPQWVFPGERMLARQPACVIHLGDQPYSESTTTYSLDITGTNTDPDNARLWFRAVVMGDFPGYAPIVHGAPNVWMHSDHEMGGDDDWDHSTTNAVGIPAAIPAAPTQAEVDAHWATYNPHRIAYHAGNPSDTYPSAAAQRPGEALTGTPISNYPPTYCTWSIGPAQFFLLDCISHRDAVTDTDDADKSMLGTEQLSQLQVALAACELPYKVICCDKMTYPHPQKVGNQDSWRAYTTERDSLLSWIHSNITGCIWITGDQHYPHVASLSTAGGDSIDHVAVCACPGGVQLNDQIPISGRDEICWTYGQSDAYGDRYWGELEITDAYLEASIYRARRGERVWSGRVLPGSNALTHPELAAA